MAAVAAAGATADAALPTPTVTATWLHANLSSVKVVDASWFMPNANRDAQGEYSSKRIPGAVFFDLDGVSDRSSPLPHMLPAERPFAAAMDALRITNTDRVVVYDATGLFSAARAWWMFQTFGHEQVAVLEGGLPGWERAGYAVDTSAPSVPVTASASAAAAAAAVDASFRATLRVEAVRSMAQMLDNVKQPTQQVVDARSAGRFNGTAPEPRPGLRGGHIPGSRNIPFDQVLTAEGALKPEEELKGLFAAAGVTTTEPIIASCGTGVTACVLALALAKLEAPGTVAVYDGSWSEWGAVDSNPVHT